MSLTTEERRDRDRKRSPDGFIRFVATHISAMDPFRDDRRCSPEVEVGGVLWNLDIFRDFLAVDAHLNCKHNQSSPWSIDVDAEFTLIHSDCTRNIKYDEMRTLRNSPNKNLMEKSLIAWDEEVDKEKASFVKDDKITVEVRFWISYMNGIKILPRFDFTDANEPSHDVTVVIDGAKIFVNKQILAIQSPVFKSMFFGDFVEKNKKEFVLSGVDHEEFIEMLHIIYPSSGKKITDGSAEFLLKLGEQFKIAGLIDRVEKFLIDSASMMMSNMEKLRIAVTFKLFGLQEHCISNLKSAKEFKDLQESPLFNGLCQEAIHLFDTRRAEVKKIDK